MKYYVVDAFTDKLFQGNPAGICILDSVISDELMQKIAFENNLAETAFLWKEEGNYQLRWFTPETEIDLCGHATLATAYVVMTFMDRTLSTIQFQTKSGVLTVDKKEDMFYMNFPNRNPTKVCIPQYLEEAVGCKVLEASQSRDLIVLLESEKQVRELTLDIDMIRKISKDVAFGVVVTAKGDSCDFVSRFFAPNAGIIEDPVTGSSHSSLIPYWYEKLHKTNMVAKQLSKRGGTLECIYANDRVIIGGNAVCYLSGEISY